MGDRWGECLSTLPFGFIPCSGFHTSAGSCRDRKGRYRVHEQRPCVYREGLESLVEFEHLPQFRSQC